MDRVRPRGAFRRRPDTLSSVVLFCPCPWCQSMRQQSSSQQTSVTEGVRERETAQSEVKRPKEAFDLRFHPEDGEEITQSEKPKHRNWSSLLDNTSLFPTWEPNALRRWPWLSASHALLNPAACHAAGLRHVRV